jgi:hypothetical protein
MAGMPVVIAIAAFVLLGNPSAAHAWGSAAHHVIMDRAIALLPPEIRPLFERNRAMVVERAVDPDSWRTAGIEQEPPNHFLDIDWDGYGPYPFDGLPRDYSAAVAKFGRDRVIQNGTLPWRVEEMFGNLRRAFEAYPKGDLYGYNRFNVLFLSAVIAHYVSDAHQPLHGVINYTGQLTGQNGVHNRFEDTAFERFQSRLTVSPSPIAPVANPRMFIFDRILEDTRLVPAILEADADAIGARDLYDDQYYDAFFTSVRPVMERRLNESIAGVAAVITGAWEAAGKPPVPVEAPRLPQRRRR